MSESDLDQLLDTAARRDRPADEVWPAAAAAIEVLFWNDRFHDAAELALAILRDFADEPGELADQKKPFDHALLASVHAGEDPLERINSARAYPTPGSVLGKRLQWLADNLPRRGVRYLLGDTAETDTVEPFRRPEQALADRDPAELTEAERTRLWNACSSRNQYPTAARLFEVTGETPSRWPVAVWFASHLADDAGIERAVAVLIDVLPWWIPYEAWDIVPTDPVLRPHLRRLATPELRAAVLARAEISKVPGISG